MAFANLANREPKSCAAQPDTGLILRRATGSGRAHSMRPLMNKAATKRSHALSSRSLLDLCARTT